MFQPAARSTLQATDDDPRDSTDATQRVCTSEHQLRAGPCCSGAMKDLQEKLEKLRVDAADCELISNLATDYAKRALFARLSRQLLDMAAEVESLIAAKSKDGTTDETSSGA